MDAELKEVLLSIRHEMSATTTALVAIEHRLGNVEERLGAVEERLVTVEQRIGTVEQRIESMDERITTEVAGLHGRITAEVTGLHGRIDDLHRHFDVVAEHLETQIATVAEGFSYLREQREQDHEEYGARFEKVENRVTRLETKH